MLRELVIVLAVVAAVSAAADTGLAMIKKNHAFMDPPYCFAYERTKFLTFYVCNGYQYDCSIDTNKIGTEVSFSANCGSPSELRAFANSDFPSRYSAYVASLGK